MRAPGRVRDRRSVVATAQHRQPSSMSPTPGSGSSADHDTILGAATRAPLLSRARRFIHSLRALHRADDGSLRLLSSLGGQLLLTRIGMILTYHDTDIVPGEPVVVRRRRRARPVARQLSLRSSTRATFATSLARVAERSIDVILEELHERSGGTLLFVAEPIWLLTERRTTEVPATVRDAIAYRFSWLPSETRRALDVVAFHDNRAQARHPPRHGRGSALLHRARRDGRSTTSFGSPRVQRDRCHHGGHPVRDCRLPVRHVERDGPAPRVALSATAWSAANGVRRTRR